MTNPHLDGLINQHTQTIVSFKNSLKNLSDKEKILREMKLCDGATVIHHDRLSNAQ